MSAFKTDRIFYPLLLFALMIRLPGIWDGLPAVYNSTEYFLAKMALNFGARETLDPGYYIYPTFYTYFLFIQYGIYFIFQYVINPHTTAYSFAIQFLTDPSGFYLLSRSVNVFVALATICVFWYGLRKYCSEKVAFYSTLMMILSSYMVTFSTYATADILMVFFSSLTIIYFYRLLREPTPLIFFLSGLFAGLATAAKYNAGFLFFGVLGTIYFAKRQQDVNWIRSLFSAISGLLLGFIIPNPLWLIYPQRFYDGLKMVSAQMFSAVSAEHGLPYLWEATTLLSDELIIGLIFLVAMIYYFLNYDNKHAATITVLLLTFLYVGSWNKKGIDYLFAVYPAWMILAGYFLSTVIEPRIPWKYKKEIIIILVFLPSALGVCYADFLYLRDDTREQATNWIIDNLEKEAVLCYDNSHYDLGVYDPDRFLVYGEGASRLPAQIKEGLADYRGDERQVHFTPILVTNPSCTLKTGNPYETQVTQFRRRRLSELIRLKVDYLITNRRFYERYLSAQRSDYPPGIQIGILEVQAFYQQIHSTAVPVITFKADFCTPGPEIRIYNLQQMGIRPE